MNDPRLKTTKTQVRKGTCLAIPAGTIVTLCSLAGQPARQLPLASTWYVSVHDVEPEVEGPEVA